MENILGRFTSDTVYVTISLQSDSHAVARILKEPNSPFEIERLPYGFSDMYSIEQKGRLGDAFIEGASRIEDQVSEAYKKLMQQVPTPQCEIGFDVAKRELHDSDSLLNVVCAYLVQKREPFFAYAFTLTSAGSTLVGVFDPNKEKILRPQ